MATWNDSNVITEYAAAAIAKWLRVKYTAEHVVNVAGVADRHLGVAFAPAFAANDPIPVQLSNKSGTQKYVANAAIAANADVYTAAAGKVGAAATGAFLIGKARHAVTGDGQIVEVVPVEQLGAASP